MPPSGLTYVSTAEQLAEKLSSFRPLDSAQTAFLRGVFLALSERPHDQEHVRAFVRAHYRDIPAEARSQLGKGVLEMFQPAPAPSTSAALASIRGSSNGAVVPADAAQPVAGAAPPSSDRPTRITWKSFSRVCAAIGLVLNEKEGQQAIRSLSSEEPPPSQQAQAASAGAAAAAASSSVVAPAVAGAALAAPAVSAAFLEPGMSFDDFLMFYASLSKPLSPTQELMEVWRLLDEQLDGRVPLRVLRQVMIGLEKAAPSTGSSGGSDPPRFFDSNYKYGWTAAQRGLSAEQLIDQTFLTHFTSRGMDLEQDSITFADFCDFMYS